MPALVRAAGQLSTWRWINQAQVELQAPVAGPPGNENGFSFDYLPAPAQRTDARCPCAGQRSSCSWVGYLGKQQKVSLLLMGYAPYMLTLRPDLSRQRLAEKVREHFGRFGEIGDVVRATHICRSIVRLKPDDAQVTKLGSFLGFTLQDWAFADDYAR